MAKLEFFLTCHMRHCCTSSISQCVVYWITLFPSCSFQHVTRSWPQVSAKSSDFRITSAVISHTSACWCLTCLPQGRANPSCSALTLLAPNKPPCLPLPWHCQDISPTRDPHHSVAWPEKPYTAPVLFVHCKQCSHCIEENSPLSRKKQLASN